MGIITFLKRHYKKQLLKKLDSLKKLSSNYLESSETYAKLIHPNCSTAYITTCNFNSCSFNSVMYNSYHSNLADVFYNNYIHFERLHRSIEKKIKRIEKKLQVI